MKFFPNDGMITLYVLLIIANPSPSKEFVKTEYHIKHNYYRQMSEGQNERKKVAVEVPNTKHDHEYRVYSAEY